MAEIGGNEISANSPQASAIESSGAASITQSYCPNGHQLEAAQLSCTVCGLSERAESVHKKIREAKLSVDELVLSRALLCQTRRELENEWLNKRASYPDSGNELLAALLERKLLTEEDLIILISASPDCFISAEAVLDSAEKLAAQTFGKRGRKPAQLKNLRFEREAAAQTLKLSRSEIYEEIDARSSAFARCGVEVIDGWADNYRLERYLPLDKCLVLLTLPKELWLQLPKQQYISEILNFGQRRIMAGINQGPLVYLRLARNSSTLDLQELDHQAHSSRQILELLLGRASGEIELSQEILKNTPMLERRVRNLVQKTSIFKRDTGKHGLFMGFPFIALRSLASGETKVKLKVAPVLIFPVRIDAQIGNKGKIALAASDSDEIRLNPALSGILGLSPKEEEAWKEALEELLSAESFNPDEVVRRFAEFCDCSDLELTPVPGKEFVSELDHPVLSYSAALFHCDFAGKAVADDLSSICGQPIAGTALELVLRVKDSDEAATAGSADKIVEAKTRLPESPTDSRSALEPDSEYVSGSHTEESYPEGSYREGSSIQDALNANSMTAGVRNSAGVQSPSSSYFDPDDFAVIAADPSQEIAVQQSRLKNGLHIEGPPGTGKSQTIVNIIADCTARNETVLVICQKQAALSVVEKRLKAEGLGPRLFLITDISKDRQSVLRSLREQLDERRSGKKQTAKILRKERIGLCMRIQNLEEELNRHHEAIHSIDENLGLSYRQVLGELIEIESEDPYILKLPRLRVSFRDFDNSAATALAEECASIANLWLESKYEISPLHDLKEFVPDEADAQLIMREFARFIQAEEQRRKTLSLYPRSADVDDISLYVAWLRENEDYIREIPRDVRLNLSRWVSLFFPEQGSSNSLGTDTIAQLEAVAEELNKLNKIDHSPRIFHALARLSNHQLNSRIKIAVSALSKGGFLNRISPLAAYNRYRLRKLLALLNLPASEKSAQEFLKAALLERKLRPHRELVEQISDSLNLELPEQSLELMKLQNFVSVLLNQLAPVAELSNRLRSCPLSYDAREFAGSTEMAAFDQFNESLQGVIRRHAAKTESLNCLNSLCQWFSDEWLSAQRRIISSSKGNIEAARHIERYLPTMVAFQEFRLRAKSMSPLALEILASLRVQESALSLPSEAITSQTDAHKQAAESQSAKKFALESSAEASIFPPIPQSFILGQFAAAAPAPLEKDEILAAAKLSKSASELLVRRIGQVIRREACIAWKSRFETSDPALMIPKEEINYKLKSLADADKALKELNRKILAEPAPDANIAEGKKWEELTRLSGARARRLRELLASGSGLGLMQLRPIWLMNPETASRLLPLTPGLFDVVIFDEASQLLIEYAFPTLFRAKRAIVSGDEKQMPPPNFFSARVENDEILNMDEDEIDEMLPQAERDRIEEAWNRREIKDCPDLLNLAGTVLPTRSLQIHYRSEYKELIAFSNAAFYSSTLSVPSKRPASVVKQFRPIEVVAVNSVYDKQVNRGEAEKIAEILRQIWSAPQGARPTVGVISFNLKQAELIQELLQDLALRNESFRQAYEQESQRQEDGEDLGFFVKNLENVQGDERDIIIFSTTFGLDQSGKFRRNFGKLGQEGGERRLNVAITRAKRKVILVTSLPCEKISDYLHRSAYPAIPRDYLQAYIDYAAKLSSGSLEAAEQGLRRLAASDTSRKRFDSDRVDPFVQDVAAYVRSLGYQPVLGNRSAGDAFEIDIAIENPKSGLYAIAIECDAPDHNLLRSAKHREIWRQTVLGKSVARIHRISSRDWYQRRDREKELLKIAIVQALANGES